MKSHFLLGIHEAHPSHRFMLGNLSFSCDWRSCCNSELSPAGARAKSLQGLLLQWLSLEPLYNPAVHLILCLGQKPTAQGMEGRHLFLPLLGHHLFCKVLSTSPEWWLLFSAFPPLCSDSQTIPTPFSWDRCVLVMDRCPWSPEMGIHLRFILVMDRLPQSPELGINR